MLCVPRLQYMYMYVVGDKENKIKFLSKNIQLDTRAAEKMINFSLHSTKRCICAHGWHVKCHFLVVNTGLCLIHERQCQL